MNYERSLPLLFGFCLLSGFILSTVHATRCEYCNKEFTCVKRHTWRCRARITSSDIHASTSVLQDNNYSSNDRDSNTSTSTGQCENVNNDDQLLPCVCGRKFKGRQGLRRHQCTCKIKKLLDVGNHDSTKSAERIDDLAECMNESSESQIDDDPTRTDTDDPVVLPGVHLPRNAKDWDEANTFFNIKFSDALYLPIESLDKFTRNFQRSVYDYFAENYGTMKNDDAASDENLDRMSMKDLKKKLSWLKKTSGERNTPSK